MLSAKFPVVIQSDIDAINSISVPPFNGEKATQMIKTYFHLCCDLRFHKVITNWNVHPSITTSLSLLTPVLNKVDTKNLNSLIVSLTFMGVFENSIWKKLEEEFIKSGHTSLETPSIPMVMNGFSSSKCNEPKLWTLLIDKLNHDLETSSNINLGIILITYRVLGC